MEKIISTIAIKTSKGVQSIKVLYDGQFEVMGKRLLNHYSKSYMPILLMMKKGNLVSLGDNLKKYDVEKEPNGTLDLTGMNKDRIPMKVYETLADLVQTETKSEYMYLWDTDKWYGMKVEDGKPYLGYFKELNKLV